MLPHRQFEIIEDDVDKGLGAFLGHVQVTVDGVVELLADRDSVLFGHERFELGEQCFGVVGRFDLVVGERKTVLGEAGDDIIRFLDLLFKFSFDNFGPLVLDPVHDQTDLFDDACRDDTLSALHRSFDLLVDHLEEDDSTLGTVQLIPIHLWLHRSHCEFLNFGLHEVGRPLIELLHDEVPFFVVEEGWIDKFRNIEFFHAFLVLFEPCLEVEEDARLGF